MATHHYLCHIHKKVMLSEANKLRTLCKQHLVKHDPLNWNNEQSIDFNLWSAPQV